MSKPTPVDEKHEPGNVEVFDSDGTNSVDTLTALIAEGEGIY